MAGEAGYEASFRLEGAFDQNVEETIASGLPVTFEFRVEIFQRRAMWMDPVHVQRMVRLTVDFDSLTGQYHLTKDIDGQVADSAVADKPDEMRRWMTELSGLVLGPLRESTREPGKLLLRVKCRLRSRFVFFFFPRAVETRWARIPLPPLAPREVESRSTEKTP